MLWGLLYLNNVISRLILKNLQINSKVYETSIYILRPLNVSVESWWMCEWDVGQSLVDWSHVSRGWSFCPRQKELRKTQTRLETLFCRAVCFLNWVIEAFFMKTIFFFFLLNLWHKDLGVLFRLPPKHAIITIIAFAFNTPVMVCMLSWNFQLEKPFAFCPADILYIPQQH